jgi:hypothetical protein
MESRSALALFPAATIWADGRFPFGGMALI